jgi:chemotaxis response regulator CheB
MITMTNPVATIHGALPCVESVVSTYARAWKQRPSGVILGGFGTDNSTGVSAEERRHL